jgi:hypothetical protein
MLELDCSLYSCHLWYKLTGLCFFLSFFFVVGMVADEMLMQYVFSLAVAQASVSREVMTRRRHLEQDFDRVWQSGSTHVCVPACNMAFPWFWCAESHSFVWTIPESSDSSGTHSRDGALLLESDNLESSALSFGCADLQGHCHASASAAVDSDGLMHAPGGAYEVDIGLDNSVLVVDEMAGGDVTDAKTSAEQSDIQKGKRKAD